MAGKDLCGEKERGRERERERETSRQDGQFNEHSCIRHFRSPERERDTRRLTPRSLDRLEAAPRRRRRRRSSVARAAADLRVAAAAAAVDPPLRRSVNEAVRFRAGTHAGLHLAEAGRLKLRMSEVSLAAVAVVVVSFPEPVSASAYWMTGY